jgi:hypothetical protein
MTGKALVAIVRSFDDEVRAEGNGAVFTLQGRQIVLVFDETAGRMRLITPILPAELLTEDILMRMSQANYDSALDARYAVANGQVLATFLRPLPTLTREDFLSGVAQVYTAAESFGTTYSSGATMFGGGDSGEIFDDLLKKLESDKEARQRI